jgi:integrase
MSKRANGEGCIYQRADGRWTAQMTVEGKRQTLYGKNQGDVRRKLDAAKRALEEGRPIVGDRRSLGQYLDDWLGDVIEPSGLSPKTKADYRDIVHRQLVPLMGRIPLLKLRPQQIQQFLNAQREKGYSPRSVQYHHAVLRSALNQAVRWDILQRNPAERVNVPRPPPGQGTVVVSRPKTTKSRRTVRITDDCADALRAHRSRQAAERLLAGEGWQDHDLVFPSSVGTPLDPRNLTRSFHALCDRAGLPRERLHNLRHSAASFLLAQGVPLRVVMEILGHSSIAITADLYTHVVPALEQDAAERVGRALRRSG